MICTKCGADAADFMYCPNCGEEVREPQNCLRCGTDVRGLNFCPNCGDKVPKLSRCHHCGADTKGFNYCPNCGEEVLKFNACLNCGADIKDYSYCPNCGEPVKKWNYLPTFEMLTPPRRKSAKPKTDEELQPDIEEQENPHRNDFHKMMIAAGIINVLTCIAFIFFALWVDKFEMTLTITSIVVLVASMIFLVLSRKPKFRTIVSYCIVACIQLFSIGFWVSMIVARFI